MSKVKTRKLPACLPPNERELETWNALSREEQVRRYREELAHPDCAVVTNDTMADLLAEAQTRLASRDG